MKIINEVTIVVAYIVASIWNSRSCSRYGDCRCSESCGDSSRCWIAISVA